MSVPKKRNSRLHVEESVKCTECGARPGVRCVTDGGRSRQPHADRIARWNGLVPTPAPGRYVRPQPPLTYDSDEQPRRRAAP